MGDAVVPSTKSRQSKPSSLVSRPVSLLVLFSASIAIAEILNLGPAAAYVPLMAGQWALPLNGKSNTVPVLHSNQPEIIRGAGILINTQPGTTIAAEAHQPLRNPEFTFNGDFGLHMHHKYYPNDASRLGGSRDRGLLTIGVIAINPGHQSVTLTFQRGSVKNSFEAPHQLNQLMGVIPLGRRPWNTGPGDATAVQMLRGQRDRQVPEVVTIPPRSRKVLISTALPARGIANGLLRGHSNGAFQMAVVASEESQNDQDLIAILDQGQLALGGIYLNRVHDIEARTLFSRVAGVASGDHYTASIRHDFQNGALDVPLTSTHKHHFGTQ